MGEKLRIEVPMLPPASASPNSRVDRRAASGDKRVYHDAVYYFAMEAVGRTDRIIQNGGRRRLDVHFVFPQRRKRDRDNLIARFKSGQDALVAVGLLVDDSPEWLTAGQFTWEVDKDRASMTIIELSEV